MTGATPPEPRDNPGLLGHAEAEALAAEAIRSGRMHHAWLITGPEGVGKATLAFRIARAVLARGSGGDRAAAAPGHPAGLAVDPAHPVFRRVAAGTHADLLTVARAWDEKRRRMRGEIVVDDVRRVGDFLRLTPAEGGWRVVVVDGAEHLNRNAANALLKMLEEPPPRALLLLTCAAPGRLLPTIRSRCRRLRLAALDAAAMRDALQLLLPDVPEAERERLAALAEGSPGRALHLAEEGGLKLAGLAEEVLRALPEVPMLRAYELADALARTEDGFGTFMDLLRGGIARAVRDAARGQADPAAARLAGLRPAAAWVEVWGALTRLQTETERFALDKRQAIVSTVAVLNGDPPDSLPLR